MEAGAEDNLEEDTLEDTLEADTLEAVAGVVPWTLQYYCLLLDGYRFVLFL